MIKTIAATVAALVLSAGVMFGGAVPAHADTCGPTTTVGICPYNYQWRTVTVRLNCAVGVDLVELRTLEEGWRRHAHPHLFTFWGPWVVQSIAPAPDICA